MTKEYCAVCAVCGEAIETESVGASWYVCQAHEEYGRIAHDTGKPVSEIARTHVRCEVCLTLVDAGQTDPYDINDPTSRVCWPCQQDQGF